jgi:hypothetical protein
MADRFPITPESLVHETLQAVTLLRERGESSPGCVTIRTIHLDQIEAKLHILLALLTAPPTPAVVREMRPLVQALAAELDRLGWSSDTAPRGPLCLDVFPTNETGVVAVEHLHGPTCFTGEALLAILQQLATPLSYHDLWQAMQPAKVDE